MRQSKQKSLVPATDGSRPARKYYRSFRNRAKLGKVAWALFSAKARHWSDISGTHNIPREYVLDQISPCRFFLQSYNYPQCINVFVFCLLNGSNNIKLICLKPKLGMKINGSIVLHLISQDVGYNYTYRHFLGHNVWLMTGEHFLSKSETSSLFYERLLLCENCQFVTS